MTWYTGTCGSNGHGFTIHVSFMVKCVRYTGFGSIGFVTLVQPFPMIRSLQDIRH
jgi:hypothetical protein